MGYDSWYLRALYIVQSDIESNRRMAGMAGMSVATQTVIELAALLLDQEYREDDSEHLCSAIRVCEKLGELLVKLAGPAGFRTLLVRALALATYEVPALKVLRVMPDGTLHRLVPISAIPAIPAIGALATPKPLACKSACDGVSFADEAASDAVVLVAQLLALLHLFIGESLTRQLVQQAWPHLSLPSLECDNATPEAKAP